MVEKQVDKSSDWIGDFDQLGYHFLTTNHSSRGRLNNTREYPIKASGIKEVFNTKLSGHKVVNIMRLVQIK